MNPAITPCTAPPGYYGGSYLPSFNQGQMGYPFPCIPVPGNYNVPFPGYGGPYIQPFSGPPQPCPSIPYAYGPYPGMFPPGYMVPPQVYPEPGMYGGPPMPSPLTQSQNGGAVQSSTMSPIEIPGNNQDQEQRDGSSLMRPGDASSCTSGLPATPHHQQQMSTVPRKCPPGFPQIPSGEMSPAGMQWNTLVSQAGVNVPGLSHTDDIEDKDQTEGRSVELWPLSSEYSTASCQTTPDTDTIPKCKQTLDLTSDTQPPWSDVLPEHSNEIVVNAQTINNLQEPSYQELVTDQKETATSSIYTPPIHDEEFKSKKEIGEEVLNADSETLSVPATAVYHDTTESDCKDGTTRFTWNAANKDFPLTYRECFVVFHFVNHGLGIPSGLPLENKCWAVPWLTEIM